MPRYIDADALKAKYEQMLPEIGDGYHKETLQDVLFELDYAPTISPDELRGVGKWISVEERLPEESGYTIVFCADGDRRHVTFAKYQKTPKRWELSGARSYWRVLRWMPLPEPPQEVNEDG